MPRSAIHHRVERRILLALALALSAMSCSRRNDGTPQPTPTASAATVAQPPATPLTTTKSAIAGAEPQPDFLGHPPVHLKPPCASSSAAAANDGDHPCVTLTLQCTELDRGEPVWLATTPAVAKIRLPEGAKGLRVTDEDQVSATVCCQAKTGDRGPVKAHLRLFTNEVAGTIHPLECR